MMANKNWAFSNLNHNFSFKDATFKDLYFAQGIQDYIFCNLLTSLRLPALSPEYFLSQIASQSQPEIKV
jgi:hypothetical protein